MYRKKKKNYKKRFSFLLKGLTYTEIYNLKKKFSTNTKNRWLDKRVHYTVKNPHLKELGELILKKKQKNTKNIEGLLLPKSNQKRY